MATESYDVVGDVHGQATKLEGLLHELGYVRRGIGYKPPLGRQLVLLGDLIDTGPGQLRVLEIARSMLDNGDARIVMGNHEFNAIGFATRDPSKGHEECLRPNLLPGARSRKNREQHEAFLTQIGEGSARHKDWINWFKTLPPFLDLGGIRVVHGCWDQEAVDILRENGWGGSKPLSEELLFAAYDEGSRIKWARNLLTCGLELPLSEGKYITDAKGHQHGEVRIASWRDWARELHEIALVPKGQETQLEGMPWPAELVISRIEGSPIFVGHHWFTGHPVIESPKLACLDWSAARGGPLVAYRWDGGTHLVNENLVWQADAGPGESCN